jgi:hypothetical protein
LFVLRISDLQKWLTIILFFVVLIAGCALSGRVQTQAIRPIKPRELPSGQGWWTARFRMHWPPDTEPTWYMDLYLAHQVIAPQLKQYEKEIFLWRFHRRAARDDAGRRFSFIFYSSPQTAEKIFNGLKADPLLAKLKSAGVIDQIGFDDPAQITRPNLEDTADKSWPLSVQKTWPFYIMGASQMWLNLIAEVAAEKPTDIPPASIEEIEAFYQHVDETITQLWQKEGRHAFMHHLNALFEYEPLIYWEKKYLDF